MATPITMIITDLGNNVEFELSNGHKFLLNKLNMQVKKDSKFVYVTDAGGFIDSAENKTMRLDYNIVTSPVYTGNGDLYNDLISMIAGVSLGGGGGAGGGNNTWSVAQGDFTAEPTVGTKNITINGLSWTFSVVNVIEGVIKRANSAGDIDELKLSNVSVAGKVITLGDEDDFASGDIISVTLVGPDKAYNEGTDAAISEVSNPDSAKWTSPEHLVDLSAQAADTLFYVIPIEGYKDVGFHWKFTNSNAGDTITMTLWGTNNADADDSADTDWVDISGDELSKTLTVTNGTVEFIEMVRDLAYLKLMVKLVVISAAATNAVDIYIKKKAL